MAKQERAIRTRRIILEAAGAVFDEQGYEAATISDILARAGVTKGALYFHFPSKEELARGVLDAQTSVLEIPPQTCKLQEMVDVAMCVGASLSSDPLLRGSMRLGIEYRSHALDGRGESYRAWATILEGLLVEAFERGELQPHVVPAETAMLIVGCFTGIQLTSQILTEREDLGKRLSTLFQHIMPSCAAPSVLLRLDIAADRGARVLAQIRAQAGEQAADQAVDPAAEEEVAQPA
jgi:AcrR family transcriptional regulator